MESINLNKVYKASEDVVAREIKGELIIIPLVSGIADIDDELFSLNDTAKAIWKQLDGYKNLAQIAAGLASEYNADLKKIESDVLGLMGELFKRKMVLEVG
jgi:hypothetical protein